MFLQCLSTSAALQYHLPFCLTDFLSARISPLSMSLTPAQEQIARYVVVKPADIRAAVKKAAHID